jgi:peptidoglycan/xylan/chitin deacetylase (PgdA/CDA1 family)
MIRTDINFNYIAGVVVVTAILFLGFGIQPIYAVGGPNIISNADLETAGTSGAPQSWYKGRWGSNTAVFSYPVTGLDGSKAAQVTLSNRVSGDAKWAFNDVALQAGQEYVYEDFYKSTAGTFVTAQYKLSNGSFIYKDLAQPAPAASWTKVSATFTVPAGVVSGTVFHLINVNGTLAIDNVSLRTTDTPPITGRVTLTFDDGHRGMYENAIPILSKYGLKSSQYIITGRFHFPGYVNQNEVLHMQSLGHEIGAHTRTHRDLTLLSQTEAQNEIAGSRSDLLAIGVNSVDTFAYPFGAYNSTVRHIVVNSGFKGARASNGGFNVAGADKYVLSRQSVERGTTFAQVKGWVDEAMNSKKWLVLVFHKVDSSGEAYAITPALLDQIASYLKAQSIPIVTLREGLNTI